jgi:hypothetical protein
MTGATAFVAGLAMTVMACAGTPAQPTRRPQATTPTPPPLTPFVDQTWSALTADGWRYLRRTSSRDADIVADATAPVSPPSVLRVPFTPGMHRDSEPTVHWIRLPESKELSMTWWLKLSRNWTPSPAGAAKLTFLHAAPDGQGQVYLALVNARAPHAVIANTEWAPYGQRVWTSNVSTTPIAYDRWYGVQWYVKWDTGPNAGDGVLQWWVDGVLNADHRTVTFPAAGVGFQQFEFAPTVQIPPPAEQYMYIDHTSIALAARR